MHNLSAPVRFTICKFLTIEPEVIWVDVQLYVINIFHVITSVSGIVVLHGVYTSIAARMRVDCQSKYPTRGSPVVWNWSLIKSNEKHNLCMIEDSLQSLHSASWPVSVSTLKGLDNELISWSRGNTNMYKADVPGSVLGSTTVVKFTFKVCVFNKMTGFVTYD